MLRKKLFRCIQIGRHSPIIVNINLILIHAYLNWVTIPIVFIPYVGVCDIIPDLNMCACNPFFRVFVKRYNNGADKMPIIIEQIEVFKQYLIAYFHILKRKPPFRDCFFLNSLLRPVLNHLPLLLVWV